MNRSAIALLLTLVSAMSFNGYGQQSKTTGYPGAPPGCWPNDNKNDGAPPWVCPSVATDAVSGKKVTAVPNQSSGECRIIATQKASGLLGCDLKDSLALPPPPDYRIPEAQSPSNTELPPRIYDSVATTDTNPSSESDVQTALEVAFDDARDLVEKAVDGHLEELESKLADAKKTMSAAAYSTYQQGMQESEEMLSTLGHVLTVAKYTKDFDKCFEDTNYGCSDLVHDAVKDGTDAVIHKVLPTAAKYIALPVGVALDVTDSTPLASPQQDFDPMSVINNSAATYQQKVDALQLLYQAAAKHPEVWPDSRMQWLYSVTGAVYSSGDNPNIHLTPR
jgi:hypothetical protein